MTDLATIGINVVVEGQQQAIAGLNQVAAVADTKVSPAARRVIENFQRTQQVMKRLEQQTETLNRSFTLTEIQRAGQRVAGLENVLNNTRQSMNGFGVITQQAGYQIGDFIVQVQSGTSAFVAFGQQATQMVGFLPMLAAEMNIAKVTFMGLSLSMATVTLGLSIIIPLVTAFGAAWMQTTEAADKSKSAMDSYQELLTSLNSKLVEVNTNLEAFRRGVEPDQIFETVLAIEDLVSTLETLRNTPVEGFMDAWTRGDRIAAAQAIKVELEKALEILKKQQAEEQRLETAATRRANEVRNQYREQFKEAERFKSKVSETLGVMENMAKVKLSSIFTNAMPAAQTFLDKVREIAGAYAEYGPSGVIPGTAIPRGKFTEDGMTAAARGVMNDKPSPFGVVAGGAGGYAQDTSKGGSGGGSKTNSIDSLINQLQTERETIDEWYVESQDALTSASETELQIIGGYNEAKLRLEQEYQDRIKGIRDESHSTLLTDTGNMFTALASISEAGGKRALKAQAVLSAAATMIAAYETAVKAAAEAKTIPGRIAAYAGFLASGMKAVSAIRSIGGIGGGTGGVGSATVAPTASAPSPQTVFIDSISPESLYSGETLINLFEAFYDENDKRGKVFMVAR